VLCPRLGLCQACLAAGSERVRRASLPADAVCDSARRELLLHRASPSSLRPRSCGGLQKLAACRAKKCCRCGNPAGDVHMQVSLPVAEVDGCPLGLGVMGPRGSDEDLLQLSAELMALLRPPRPEKS